MIDSNLRFLIIVLILIVIGGGAYYFLGGKDLSSPSKSIIDTYRAASKSTDSPSQFTDWLYYQNPSIGLSIRILPDWQIDEKKDANNNSLGEVTFTPAKKGGVYGSVEKIVVSTKPERATSDVLGTQADFDTWYKAKADYTQTGLVKMENHSISGQPGVIFLNSTSSNQDRYHFNVWFREGNKNYYISFQGSKSLNKADVDAFKYFLSTVTL